MSMTIQLSERGIRRSDARFPMGTPSIFFVLRSWRAEKNLSLFNFGFHILQETPLC